jgi:hypothetical protein
VVTAGGGGVGVTVADVVTGASVVVCVVVVTGGVGVAVVMVGGRAGAVTVTVTVAGVVGGRPGGITTGVATRTGSGRATGATAAGAAATGARSLTCGPVDSSSGIAAVDVEWTTKEVVAGFAVVVTDAIASVESTFDPKIETAMTTITARAAVAPRAASTLARLDWDAFIVSSTL